MARTINKASLANLGRTMHGHCVNGLSPTYNSWRKMMERCYNPNDISYKNYGDKGIEVSDTWKTFKGFLKDMGIRPTGMSLDRIDARGNYCLANCRWATKKQQANNCRSNRLVTIDGVTKTMTEWSDTTGVKVATIWNRLKLGYSGTNLISTNRVSRKKEQPA